MSDDLADGAASSTVIKRRRPRSIVRSRQKPVPESERADAASRPTVLVIEDNPSTRRVVRLTLEQHGFHVLEAANGREGIRTLELERPRLVLQDLMLPDMDGLELVAELRAIAGNSKTSILAFSGFVAHQDTTRLKAAGFDDVVGKPVDGERLAAILEAHWLLTAPPPERFGGGRAVLVADGDPLKLRVTRLRLERAGFKVRTAANGMQALELARRIRPDVLVADVMMPRLDGFGLCMALRQEPTLRALTILLMSSNEVDEGDRAHARRSGANRLVQHSPDLKELTQVLRGTTIAPEATPVVMPDAMLGLEKERSERLLAQLERQGHANQRLARRCAALAAELTVFSGISEAVVRSGDLGAALDEALATCLDAGGISAGVLYLLAGSAPLRVRSLGALPGWKAAELGTFFNQEALLRWIINCKKMVEVPSRELPTDLSIDLLQSSGASNLLIVPLVWRETPLGALVMISRQGEVDRETWQSFAQGMANHITQALALIDAFASKESAEADAREQASLLRTVLDNISEGIVVADTEGNFVLWNAAARSIAGEQAVSAPLADWPAHYGIRRLDRITPVRVDELPIVRAIGGETTAETRFFVQPDPTVPGRIVSVSARPLANERGERSGAVTVFRDVTEQDLVEAQLQALSPSAEGAGFVNVRRALETALTLTAQLEHGRTRVIESYAPVPLAIGSAPRLTLVLLNVLESAARCITEARLAERELRLAMEVDPMGRVLLRIAFRSAGIQPQEDLRACEKVVEALGGELSCHADESDWTEVRLALRAAPPVDPC